MKMPVTKFLLYYHTLKYIKNRQLFYRIKYHFFGRRFFKIKYPKYILKSPFCSSDAFLKNDRKYFNNNRAFFINQYASIEHKTIWNDPSQDKLWLYQLHYFDALNTQDKDQTKRAYELLERWTQENPPVQGIGWDPYPTSLRIINIVKYALSGNTLSDEVTKSLYLQAAYLYRHCEYHLLGNHLYENFRALCFAGLYFDIPAAKKWFKKGYSGLKREIKEQILKDGGHFELSPMYHCIILTGLLDLQQLFYGYAQHHLFVWHDVVSRMLKWLHLMRRNENEICYFNDAANKMTASPAQLFSYANQLGYPISFEELDLKYLDQSGYVILPDKNIKVIIDVGSVGPNYLPAHAHADSLSFELMIDDLPIFVNLGTSCYGLSKRRQFEKATQAHNTVVINRENSSEVWHGFRVARRAFVKNIAIDKRHEGIVVSADHNGYRRLNKGLVHHRCWTLAHGKLRVFDRINSNFNTAYAYFHLHPDCKILTAETQKISVRLQNNWIISCVTDNDIELIDNQYAESFGQLRNTNTLRVALDRNTRTSELTIIVGNLG